MSDLTSGVTDAHASRPTYGAPADGSEDIDGIAIFTLPAMARIIVRATSAAVVDASASLIDRLGFGLPDAPGLAKIHGDTMGCWLGPDEWLIRTALENAADIQDRLSTALAGISHTLVDVSDRPTAFQIEGRCAEDVLATGCPIDLALVAFPVGTCTRTVFAKVDAILYRIAADAFHLEVNRSVADYVRDLLVTSSRALCLD